MHLLFTKTTSILRVLLWKQHSTLPLFKTRFTPLGSIFISTKTPSKRAASHNKKESNKRPQMASSINESLPSSSQDRTENRILTLPTILTLGRVFAIPLLAVGYYVEQSWSPIACSVLFIAASFTDWLDGFLARKMNTTSKFGAFLDPVADKLMVATALILLSSSPLSSGLFEDNKWIIPMLSLIIIGREITMSSLREWAASVSMEAYKSVAVSSWGKWKTASQMLSIFLLLLASDGKIGYANHITDTGLVLLLIAGILSVSSLALYFKSVWRYL